jgi:porin
MRAGDFHVLVRAVSLALACALFAAIASNSAFAWQEQVSDASAQAGQNGSDADQAPQVPASPPQTPQAPASTAATRKMHCRCPADPRRRHTSCNDEPFDWDETFSRDYFGIRDKLRQLGITPSMSYTGALQTNVTGQTHQIWAYTGQLVAGLNVDFEKLLKIPGMSVYVDGSWGTGTNLSASLNNLFPVNTLYAPSYYLGEMYLQQTFLDQDLRLVGGRIAAGNTFAQLPIFANYVNYGLNPNPYPLGYNDITFFAPPTGTEWGAQASYDVSKVFQIDAGMFDTNLNAANGQNHGTDWTLQQGNKGALVIAQASYFPHGINADQGKQGLYTVGVISNNNSFPALRDKTTESGGYVGAFVLGQETVYQPDGPDTPRGLTIWGSWAYNAKPLTSPIPLFWAAGASYQGVFKRRSQDAASVGWIYGQVSNYLPDAGAEQVLELNYRWLYRRFLTITPDFQYIWNPGGHSAPGVTVVGVQAALTF